MESQKDNVKEISKNCKVRNYIEQMKINHNVKELIMEELRKKINSYNRKMNHKKGLQKKCVKKSGRKCNKE